MCDKNDAALLLQMGADKVGAPTQFGPGGAGEQFHGEESGRVRLHVDHGVETTTASQAQRHLGGL